MISVVESLPAHMRPWGFDLPFHSQKQLFTSHYNELTGFFFKKVLYMIRSFNNSRLILSNQKPREEKPSRPPTCKGYFIFL